MFLRPTAEAAGAVGAESPVISGDVGPLKSGANVIKNTTVNYCGNFNPTFSKVKMTLKNDLGLKNITAIIG